MTDPNFRLKNIKNPNDPVEEALAEAMQDFTQEVQQPPNMVSLPRDQIDMLQSLAANMNKAKPKERKDVSARVFLAGMLIWFSWLGVNIMAGLEINSDRAAFLFKPDANFLATLGYMAIGAASVVTGTVVADKVAGGKPK